MLKKLLPILLVGLIAAPSIAASAKPNIIYVLCDDLGYGDVRALNPEGKIATPNLDRLAAQGIAFTDAHTGSAVCSPTRYGVMTGRYCWRSPLQKHVLGGLSPRLIEPGRMTVANLLKDHGYHTACVGKWHLGMDWARLPGKPIEELAIEKPDQVHNVDFSKPTTNGPNSVGFDYYYGIAGSADMVPYTFIENDHVTKLPTAEKSFALMAGQPKPRSRLGPAAPDFELEDILPTFTSKAIEYVRSRAEAAKRGEPFFLYLPLASPHSPIAPSKQWLGKSGINPYADFVMQTDDSIGQLLRTLEEQGLADNTLVIVTSDNGCSPIADFDALLAKGHNPSYIFRGEKADIYDGGHRVAFLVRWPDKVQGGRRSDHLMCHTDFMATVADILEAKLPPTAAEDSISFFGALTASDAPPAREVIVHHSINGAFALRRGMWKLEFCPGSGGWSKPRPGLNDTSKMPLVQLYDLKSDIGEQTNLQAEQPKIVAELTALMEQYVTQGRSTPGAPQQNTVAVDFWKAGKEDHKPLPPRKGKGKTAAK
jgi:arylsulfatase A-like enzyme